MSSLIASQPPRSARASREADLRALARRLKALGLANMVASFLESGGAFGVLGAQMLYLGQPVLGSFWPDRDLRGLAESLEDPEAVETFARLLREEAS